MTKFAPRNIQDRQDGSYRPASGATTTSVPNPTRVAVTQDPSDDAWAVSMAGATEITGTVDFDVTIRNSGLVTIISGISDTSWIEAPTVAMTGRKFVLVQNQSDNGGVVQWAYASESASATALGIRIEDGGFKDRVVGSGITVFVKMLSGSGTIAIEEGS